MTVIHESPRSLARATDIASDRLLVTLTFQRAKNFDVPPYFAAQAVANGFNALDVICHRKPPWPAQERLGLLAAIHAHAQRYAKVVVYGSSIGGYAALNFAPFLGAKVAVVASPLSSPDPEKTPYDHRWAKQAGRIKDFSFDNIAHGLASLDQLYVMYDPTGIDDLHASEIARRAPSACMLPVPYGGHSVVTFFKEAGTFDAMLIDVVLERFDPSRFRSVVRESRPRSARYFRRLAFELPERRDGLRVRLLERSLELGAVKAEVLPLLIPPLLRLGRRAEAEVVGRAAVEAGVAPLAIEALLADDAIQADAAPA